MVLKKSWKSPEFWFSHLSGNPVVCQTPPPAKYLTNTLGESRPTPLPLAHWWWLQIIIISWSVVKCKLQAKKATDGTLLSKFIASYSKDHQYKGVEIVKGDGDEEEFNTMHLQFFQSLVDGFEQHFPIYFFAGYQLSELQHVARGPLTKSTVWG